jgi:tetratricopeptide (TPR) repeat protein
LQEILAVASIEGEVFTAQVIAQVRQMAERPLLHRLSQELEMRHRLVRAQEEVQTGDRRMPRYRFRHAIFQDYMYGRISPGERRLLHGEVAAALEGLYEGQIDEMAVQLAHHYQNAGDCRRTYRYLGLAAERASRLHANDEAITHYSRAIELAERVSPDATSLTKLLRGRGLARAARGEFDQARADHDAILQIARASGERDMEWRALLDLGKLWASRDYDCARDHCEQALKLARGMEDPSVLAGSLNWMGNWHANAEDSPKAVAYHREALEIAEELGDQRTLANTLDLLGLAYLLGGDLTASVRTYDRAIALCRDLDDLPCLVTGLIARAVADSELVMLASAPAIASPDALADFEEARRIAREIESPSDEAWALWALGHWHTVRGRFDLALEAIHSGLRIAVKIRHREHEVGNRCALGNLYAELLAPKQARRQLEKALREAGELRSRVWIHRVTGALAGVYISMGDFEGARAALESALSPDTPMDTVGKRYCWARLAGLELAQGNPALALEITQRLIASAPGWSAGRVITFLWKLKGEALVALGHMEEAHSLLQAAAENAQVAGERFLQWRTHAGLGRLLSTMGQQAAAEKELSIAQVLIEELADTIPDGELRDNFLQRSLDTLRLSP